MALRILGLSFRDTWQELGTILVVHVLFLLGMLLVLPGPPAIAALFYYGHRIARGEIASERDFLQALREYWAPAWRWGLMNLAVIGLLTGDYSLVRNLLQDARLASLVQGFYLALLAGWVVLQLFTLPFLFEQARPSVALALRNSTVFVRRNPGLVLALTGLVALSLLAGTLVFMLSFVFGGAFVAFAVTHAVLADLPRR